MFQTKTAAFPMSLLSGFYIKNHFCPVNFDEIHLFSKQIRNEAFAAFVVGSGDSFTAVFISGLLKGLPLNKVHEMAALAAAFVCTQKGACPIVPFKIF